MKLRAFGLYAVPLVLLAPSCATQDTLPDELGAGVGGAGSAAAGTTSTTAGASGTAAGQIGTPTGGAGGTTGGGAGTAASGRPGTGGASGTGGKGGAGGAGGSGGVGGASAGGSSGQPAGGTAGGPMGGVGGKAAGGTAGVPVGGAGGAAGKAGSGGAGGTGMTGTPMPSSGCGKGGRPSNGLVTASGDHIYSFPTTYDGTTPFPLTFGFHGAGNTETSFRTTDAKTSTVGDFEKTYVMAYVKSMGNDWTGQLSANETKFDTVFTQVTTTYCIDLNRVFAIGHSSGAQFISNLVCRPENRLKAVGPVASSTYNGNCRKIPVMAIQGAKDSVRNSNGADWIEAFATRNACAMPTTKPTTAWDEPTCKSYSGGATVNPGCVEFQGCEAPNRTVWCSHDDPNYNGGTNHGWPCFANDALYKFFASIP